MTEGNFWYGKRVLVTGGDGFVASALIRRLVKLNAVVVASVRHQKPRSTLSVMGETDIDAELCDLMEFSAVQRLCARHRVDTIFHLAASAVVVDAAHAPISTFENNILPTLNLLETARIHNIPRVVVASSDKAYGDHADADDPEPLPYREPYALRGLDVYSASKVCADMMCQTYAYQFEMPVVVARACNIFGPGDLNFTRLIPRTTLRMLRDKSPVINEGNDNVRREYMYVDDVVTAYLLLAENIGRKDAERAPRKGRESYGWAAYNIGSYLPDQFANPDECKSIKSVNQVIAAIAKELKKEDLKPRVIPNGANFIEIPDQYLDATKIVNLGFKPKTSFDQGLAIAIDWYRTHRNVLDPLGDLFLN